MFLRFILYTYILYCNILYIIFIYVIYLYGIKEDNIFDNYWIVVILIKIMGKLLLFLYKELFVFINL